MAAWFFLMVREKNGSNYEKLFPKRKANFELSYLGIPVSLENISKGVIDVSIFNNVPLILYMKYEW